MMKTLRPLILLIVLALIAPLANAQPDASTPVSVQPRIYPLALWGPQGGFGFGAGLSVRHLGWDGSHALLTAKPAAHRGRYALNVATHDPFSASRYALLDLEYETNGRYWFHGVGPASSVDNRVHANVESALIRLRLGYRPGEGPVVIQPTLGLHRHTFHGFRENASDAVNELGVRTGNSIRYASGHSGEHTWSNQRTGLVGGLQVAFDTRDRAHYSTRGLLFQVSGKRYEGLDDLDLHFNRYDAHTYAFLPLAPHHILSARAQLTVTRDQSVVGQEAATLPFYLLPRLGAHDVPGFDRNRFFDNDRLILSLAYRFPILRLRDVAVVSGEVAAHGANVYEDVFEQAEFGIDARDTFAPDRSTYPLQAAGSIGLYVAPLFRDTLFLETALGLSADGVSAVQFKLVQSFRGLRAPFL